jgi:hypothetical protein
VIDADQIPEKRHPRALGLDLRSLGKIPGLRRPRVSLFCPSKVLPSPSNVWLLTLSTDLMVLCESVFMALPGPISKVDPPSHFAISDLLGPVLEVVEMVFTAPIYCNTAATPGLVVVTPDSPLARPVTPDSPLGS